MQKIQGSTSARAITELVNLLDSGDMITDEYYQRGHVWGVERQRKLIFSLQAGIPVGAVVIGQRNNYSLAVVDGKQRLTAVSDFINDQFTVPGEWFSDDLEGSDVVFSDLPRPIQADFRLMTTLPVCEFHSHGADHESEIFDLVNFGGVEQGDSDF